MDKELIQKIKASADIVDIATSLGIHNSNYANNICCPFHDDNDPSFRFFRYKDGAGGFKCFSGCDATEGESKDVFGLVMLSLSCHFIDAVKYVAQAISYPIPETRNKKEESPQEQAISLAQYLYSTKNLPESVLALDYLRGRGISQETIEQFGIGYAQPGNHLINYGRSKINELIELGLVRVNEDGSRYDFFRNRITIPVYSSSNSLVGFGCRGLGDAKPKYINSSDSSLFSKGEHLFNLSRVPRTETSVLVVEGYFDVIGLWQNGIKNSVCSMGTSLSVEQVELLANRFESIIFMFDGDQAGRSAAWRVVKSILPFTDKPISFRFVFLPPEKDPFDIVSEFGAQEVFKLLVESTYLSDFILNEIQKIYIDASERGIAEKLVQLNSRINSLLDGVPNSLFKETILFQLSSKTGSLIKKTNFVKIEPLDVVALDSILEKVRLDFPDCDVYIEDKSVLVVPI